MEEGKPSLISAKKLASILAREVYYRSRRREGFSRGFTWFIDPGKVSSIFKLNFLTSAFYALLSIAVSTPLILPQIFSMAEDLTVVCIIVFSALMLFGGFISIIATASFTAIFTTERLVETIYPLPIDEKTAFKAYLLALILYGGGLAEIFLFIPAFLIALHLSLEGPLTPLTPILGLAASIAMLFFSFTLGIAIGAYSEHVRRRGF